MQHARRTTGQGTAQHAAGHATAARALLCPTHPRLHWGENNWGENHLGDRTRYHFPIRGRVRSRNFLNTCNFKLHGALRTPSEMQNWGEYQGEKISCGHRHTPNTLAAPAMGPTAPKCTQEQIQLHMAGPGITPSDLETRRTRLRLEPMPEESIGMAV